MSSPKGPDFVHPLARLIGLQSPGKKNGNRNLFTNPAAQSPMMPPSGATQLLRGKRRIPCVQQDRVNLLVEWRRFLPRLLANDVYNRHD
jgi:hypothetical protein